MTHKFFKRNQQGKPVLEVRYTPVVYNGKDCALYKSLITGYWQVADPVNGVTLLDFNGRTLTKDQALKEISCLSTKT